MGLRVEEGMVKPRSSEPGKRVVKLEADLAYEGERTTQLLRARFTGRGRERGGTGGRGGAGALRSCEIQNSLTEAIAVTARSRR